MASTRTADRVAEGVCELFSYLWEQGQLDRGAKDEGERQRRMAAMHMSTDEVYGAGFRDALAAYKQCGSSLVAFLAGSRRAGAASARKWSAGDLGAARRPCMAEPRRHVPACRTSHGSTRGGEPEP